MWQPNGRGAGGWTAVLLLLAGAAGLEGCSTLGYYAQSVAGQLGLMARRRPITEVVRSPETSPALRAKLETVEAARAFASRELLLPDNGSYRSYADIDRPYVVWSVVATPEFSLAPRTWCFPVAGCVAYRGYFCEEAAHAFAAKQRAGGDDVFVGGVAAYSTLGWFDDPVPSSVAGWPAEDLAGLIFHELAHQAIYVPDDSGFNEAFAVTVQREGMRRWLAGREAALKRYRRAQRYEDRFLDLIFATRERLQAVYGSSLPDPDKRAAKARIFADLRKRWLRWLPTMSWSRAFSPCCAGTRGIWPRSTATYVPWRPWIPRSAGSGLCPWRGPDRRSWAQA